MISAISEKKKVMDVLQANPRYIQKQRMDATHE